jgi:dihydroorotate dehydrogenase
MLYPWLRFILFRLSKKDPEHAHEIALKVLQLIGQYPWVLNRFTLYKDPILEQELFGLIFRNPVGLAGGFDKNAVAIRGLATLGFGFLEVGTVTRYAQEGNPKPRIFRFPKDKALINRMGFNNEGADGMLKQFQKTNRPSIPIGISIGKSKITPLDKAVEDYLYSFRTLHSYGSYFAINVSSPNTPGLRTLQEKNHLDILIVTLQNESKVLAGCAGIRRKPLLVKVSPDLSWQAIDEVLAVCSDRNVDGLIATNTTLSRDGLSTQTHEAGGLSGKPLQNRAREVVKYICDHTALPVIGVGGIFNAQDAFAMLKAGARLIQIYTGLIYEGPFVVSAMNKGLGRLMKEYRIKQIQEIAGSA